MCLVRMALNLLSICVPMSPKVLSRECVCYLCVVTFNLVYAVANYFGRNKIHVGRYGGIGGFGGLRGMVGIICPLGGAILRTLFSTLFFNRHPYRLQRTGVGGFGSMDASEGIISNLFARHFVGETK